MKTFSKTYKDFFRWDQFWKRFTSGNWEMNNFQGFNFANQQVEEILKEFFSQKYAKN